MSWLVLFLTLAGAAPAQLNADAKAAFRGKQYAKAARLFEASAEATGKGEAWFNAGLAYFKASRPANAMRAYTLALEAGGVLPKLMPELNRRMTELRGKVAELRLVVPAGCEMTVDGTPSAVRLWLDPGLHQVLGSCQGEEVRRETLTLVGGEFRELRLEAPAPVLVPEPTPGVTPAERSGPPAAAESQPPVQKVPVVPFVPAKPRPWLVAGIVSGAVAAGAAVFSAILYGAMMSTYQRFVGGERIDVALSMQGRGEQVALGVSTGGLALFGVGAVVSFIVNGASQ
jgi:hypothetical protein